MPLIPAQKPEPDQGKQAVERVGIAAMKIIHTPEVTKSLLKIMRESQDPASGIAQCAVYVIQILYEKSKGTMPPQVLNPAGKQVLALIAELGEAAGFFKVTPELLVQAAQMAGKQAASGMNPQQVQQTLARQTRTGATLH